MTPRDKGFSVTVCILGAIALYAWSAGHGKSSPTPSFVGDVVWFACVFLLVAAAWGVVVVSGVVVQ